MSNEKINPFVTNCGVCNLEFEVPNLGWRFHGEVGYVCPTCLVPPIIRKVEVKVILE